MNCSESLRLLHRKLDHAAVAGELRSLEQHLHSCTPCTVESRVQERLQRAVATLRDDGEVPTDLAQRIADRVLLAPAPVLSFEAKRRPRWPLLREVASVLFLAMLAGGFGWYFGRSEPGIEAGSRKEFAAARLDRWIEDGATPEQAAEIVKIEADFDARRASVSEPERVREDEVRSGRILRVLSPKARETLRVKLGWTREEVERLMALALK